MSHQCYNCDTQHPVHLRRRFISKHELYVGKNGRVYTPIRFTKIDYGKKPFWMDCVTGSVFTQNGWNAQLGRLDINNMKHDQERGAAILTNKPRLNSNGSMSMVRCA